MILALGLSATPLRCFVAADVLACRVWAAPYTGTALGGSLAGHPVVGLPLAIVFALGLRAAISVLRRL